MRKPLPRLSTLESVRFIPPFDLLLSILYLYFPFFISLSLLLVRFFRFLFGVQFPQFICTVWTRVEKIACKHAHNYAEPLVHGSFNWFIMIIIETDYDSDWPKYGRKIRLQFIASNSSGTQQNQTGSEWRVYALQRTHL